MYENLPIPASDPILQISLAFREDSNPLKADLGIGVYKDASGVTPVMHAVHEAEVLQAAQRESKSYLTFAGDERFNAAMLELALGDTPYSGRARAIQTPGGGGAVRLLVELVKKANPAACLWISDPTWVNHVPIAEHVGLPFKRYRYLNQADQSANFEAMMHDLESAQSGDVVLLHGCCHNPTGADLDIEQWKVLCEFIKKRGLIPFVDLAYQGFGDSLEQDAVGLRMLASECPEMLLSVSCSKNFGLYRDRVGVAAVIAESAPLADRARGNLLSLARVNYSFPPHHGAAIVSTILNTPELKASWSGELEEMRQRIVGNRERLAALLRSRLESDRFDFVIRHRGMFSLMGLNAQQIATLREKRSVYIPPDSRLNFASLFASNIEHVAGAIASVVRA